MKPELNQFTMQPFAQTIRPALFDEPAPAISSLDELMAWYFSKGTPMLIPHDAEVYQTDDATAISVFRQGAFQVELYLLHAPYSIPLHAHPGIELVQMFMLGGERPVPLGESNVASLVHEDWGLLTKRLAPGEYHGTEGMPAPPSRGQVLLVFEKWPDGVRPHTVAAVWEGRTVGIKQDQLIQRYE